jgi:hypothetical protein
MEEYDIKTKQWFFSKKKPCDFHCVYNGERPVLEYIKKVLTVSKKATEISLEEKLKLLFSFLMVSNHSSTLDEINIIVRNKLKREPRKTFYLVSTTKHLAVSHYESFEDYRARIFSKKIIDLEYIEPKKKHEPVHFITHPLLPKIKEPVKEKKNVKREPTIKPKEKPIINICSFIITSEDNESEHSDSDSETESRLSQSSQSESDDSDKENSDYEDYVEETYDDHESEYSDYD